MIAFPDRREIVDSRVAIVFKFRIAGQQGQFVNARGGYNKLVSRVVHWKIRQADRFDNDVRRATTR